MEFKAESSGTVTHGQQVNASNTGVKPGVTLQPSGDVTTTHDGQVIENLLVRGWIDVKHNNVTIRNVRVETPYNYPIGVGYRSGFGDKSGLLIEDTEIIGFKKGDGVETNTDLSVAISPYGSWTARRVEVSGFQDGIKIISNQVVEYSWCHDLAQLPPRTVNGQSRTGSHNDCMQSTNGSNVTVRRNKLEGPFKMSTSAVILKTDFGPISNYTFEDNWFSGGSYTFYARDDNNNPPKFPSPTGIIMRNNIWRRNSWTSGPLSTTGAPFSVWQNNRYDDGAPFGG